MKLEYANILIYCKANSSTLGALMHSSKCIHPRTIIANYETESSSPTTIIRTTFELALKVVFIWAHFGHCLPFPIRNVLLWYISPFRFPSHALVLSPYPGSQIYQKCGFVTASSVSLYVRPPLDSRSIMCIDPFSLSRSIYSNMLTNASLLCYPCWSLRFPNPPFLYILRIRFHIRALVPSNYLGSIIYKACRSLPSLSLCLCIMFIMPLSYVALR